MALFGSQKPSYLGIDFGSGGIKLAELMNEKGRARLVTYAFVERAPADMPRNYIDAPEEAADLLKKMLKKAKTTSRRAVSALPISSVFSSIISVQKTAKKEELEEAVRYQARKLIPLPLEEMTVDWKPVALPTAKPDDKYVQVLLTGAAKTLIKKYIDIFSAAGLELLSLETEALALIRALIGRDRSATLILDIGGLRTNILIVENGIPFVSRSVAMGGLNVTREMAQALGIPEEQAESTKIDSAGITTFYAGGGFPKLFEKVMAPIITELTYSTNLFLSQKANVEKRIDKIILTGGGALLPNLADYLSKSLNLRAYVGDPWARVVYPEALKPVLAQIGPRYGVAVGLAMRDID
jgi:type IV pilus assembly protein PilM